MKATGRHSKNKNGGGAGASTVASAVYLQLREDILRGSLRPGEKLRADYLRKRYEAGTSPLREALNRLSADGLVERKDQRGFSVSTVSAAHLLELVKTRCWLEALALRESIRNRSPEWEENVVLAFHRLSRVPRSTTPETYNRNPVWEDLHRKFHMAIISASGSQLLLGFCAQLNDQADRYRNLAAVASFPQRNELEEHRAIQRAAINGETEEAADLLETHYARTAEIIRSSLHEFTDS